MKNTELISQSPSGEVSPLTWEEAAARLKKYGPNIAVSQDPVRWYRVLWRAFNNPFNYVLVFLAVISYLTEDMKAVIVMSVMVTVATLLRFIQEFRSIVKAESLRRLVRNKCSVLRTGSNPDRCPDMLDNRYSEIFIEELVPGDIVRLSSGDMIPADVRILESRDLFVSQSALTGEAMPVEKFPSTQSSANQSHGASLLDRPELCFLGSSVVSGSAKAVVLETGANTQMGKLGSKLTEARPPTSFDIGVNKVTWVLIRFMLTMVPLVLLINGFTKGDWVDAFFFAVAIAVGLTPEMLPMIVNANLARGAVAMAKQKVVVKNMNSIQNLGAMDVLCTDKTGTITQDRVVLIKHLDVESNDSHAVLEKAYLNSLFQTGLKNLIDRAIIDHAHEEHGIREIARSYKRIDELPFDFERRRMSVVLKPNTPGPNLLICKGAVEETLSVCAYIQIGEEIHPLTSSWREKILHLRDRENEDGLRLIAVAYKSSNKEQGQYTVDDENDLIFCGLVALLDPPKETTAEALALLREHNVKVKILTGDNPLVAKKVCRDVGLEITGILLGRQIDHLSDEQLQKEVEKTTIFAKLNPLQKARVVKALKANQHTVGFMGDGINDALALREADVGISVDSGVDLAKEAADIILLEKSLLVLEKGVVEGRRTFGNIVKYIKMTASSNFGNVFSVLVASAFLPFLPMLPIHLLIQNLLYDISQISIPWDRMDEDWLKKPRKWSSAGLGRFMICIGPISSIFDITTYLAMWHIFGADTVEEAALFQTGWFVVGLLTQTLIVHMIRTEKVPFIQSRAATPVLILTGTIMIIGCFIPFSPLGESVGMVHLPPTYWPFLITVLTCYCLLTQFLKKVYIRKFNEWL
ncbi:MAG: magnesium-translocating P-type ATPase [Methylacidiphilales bacterium]|nr:magnesium-translocating P-type ATPase [Candidatus Methylacidiphilales bacterium]MDW8350043.1 magnesium-translocating P-type ATPase [Verrucomicrobiae bacterium]